MKNVNYLLNALNIVTTSLHTSVTTKNWPKITR